MSSGVDTASLLRLPNDVDSADRVRAWVTASPVLLFDVATAISTGDGAWPAEAVTRVAQESIEAVRGAPMGDVCAAIGEMLLGREVDHALEWLRETGLLDTEVEEVFGVFQGTECRRLMSFIDEKIYSGVAFSLNQVVDGINGYEATLQADPAKLAEAELRKDALLADTRKLLDLLTRRTRRFLPMLAGD